MRTLVTFLLLVVLAAAPAAAQERDEAGKLPPLREGVPLAEMVRIPGGVFLMGDADSKEFPAHKVRVDDFMIDKTEVTNAQYIAFCDATGRSNPMFWGMDRFKSGPDYPDHAVIGISHSEASAYAKWVGKRLPTEAEWEYAARGGLEGMTYDTADTIAVTDANYKKTGADGPMPVASFRPNGYGIHDTVGNVREFVADRWAAFTGDPDLVQENPAGPEEGRWRVIKGGGWFSGGGCNSISNRNVLPRGWRDFNVGFRCARDVDQ